MSLEPIVPLVKDDRKGDRHKA